jgi:hypothetical protein
VDEAIAHTPTLVELYACKARIFKHVRGAQGRGRRWRGDGIGERFYWENPWENGWFFWENPWEMAFGKIISRCFFFGYDFLEMMNLVMF